jgi:hypothetical protein
VLCSASYVVKPHERYAFVFRVTATETRFTVYTAAGDRFDIGSTYRMLLSEPDVVTLSLTAAEFDFLRTCLHNAANRWREAITDADAGANRAVQSSASADTPEPTGVGPSVIDVEPTPEGYRRAARCFRDELAKVEQLIHIVEALRDHSSVDGPVSQNDRSP